MHELMADSIARVTPELPSSPQRKRGLSAEPCSLSICPQSAGQVRMRLASSPSVTSRMPGRGRGRPPHLPEAGERLLPDLSPVLPLTLLERRAFGCSELEEAVGLAKASIRRARRNLAPLRVSKPADIRNPEGEMEPGFGQEGSRKVISGNCSRPLAMVGVCGSRAGRGAGVRFVLRRGA